MAEDSSLPVLARRRLLTYTALVGGLAGCSFPLPDGGNASSYLTSTQAREDPQTDPGTVAQLADDVTAFGLTLGRELSTAQPTVNQLTSPYSIAVALAMAYAGAREETAAGMRKTLQFSLPDEDLHPAFNDLTRAVERERSIDDEGEPFQIRVANALWGQEGFPFRDPYLDVLARHYGAGLRTADFAGDPESARTAINEWVGNATEGKITDLLARGTVSQRTRLVLTNAIYFLASWKWPFPEADTRERTFTSLDGTETDVPVMHRTDAIPYTRADALQAVALPYVDETTEMVVVVPDDGSFETVEASLDRVRLDEIVESLQASEGTLGLPRFSYRSSFSLVDALSAMGMERAFEGGRADFSGMYDPGEGDAHLSIADVIHKAFIAVDEQGTEAAAATGVVMDVTSVTPSEPWELVVDRPFLFVIRDRETGAVLFAGRVVDGSQIG